MKKRLEAELISIAHRILKLTGKAELDQLYLETSKLYDALAVLKFVQENINIVTPKIDVAAVEQKLEHNFDLDTTINKVDLMPEIEPNKISENAKIIAEVAEVATESVQNEVVEPEIANEISADLPVQNLFFEIDTTTPIFDKIEKKSETEVIVDSSELVSDHVQDLDKKNNPLAFEKTNQPKVQQISFETLLGHQINEPIFDKKDDIVENLNTRLGKNATFGLNDKIGFVKHLFENSDEDFNRVVSQIGSFSSFAEAKDFVEQLVKPDYNNWENKEDYEQRFMEIIERKFL